MCRIHIAPATVDWQSIKLNICFGIIFFFIGVEYAVILPTINDYLLSLDADETFLGIVLASFSFAGLITAPIYGYVTDKMRSAKLSIIVGNLLNIAGNFMYFTGKNKYFILGGRILAGFGSGAMSSIMGTLSRSTTSKDRTSSFAFLLMLRQIGLIIGPGFNTVLNEVNFNLGPFPVNSHTSPGLFMVVIWLLSTLMLICLYRDRHLISEEESASKSAVSPEIRFSSGMLYEFMREEIVLLLAASFFSAFIQTGVEAALTPLTLMYFDWHGLANSYLLLAAGAIVLLTFGSVYFTSKYISDRALLTFGCICAAVGYGAFMVISIDLYLYWDGIDTPAWLEPVLAIEMMLWVVGLCHIAIPNISLYSKLTRKETQSFNQGIRIGMTRIGMILGPLWSSPMVTPSRLPIMTGFTFAISCMLIIMLLLSYKYLVPPPESVILEDEEDVNESSPLMNGTTSAVRI